MTVQVRLLCDKPGCGRVVTGSTLRQALGRMVRHWTAVDHTEHVDEILAQSAEG